jgi:hypothetical protein
MTAQRPSTVRAAAFSEKSFELGESVLDGVEAGAVGREIEQCCACRFDHLTDVFAFMAREVVHHDDVCAAARVGNCRRRTLCSGWSRLSGASTAR